MSYWRYISFSINFSNIPVLFKFNVFWWRLMLFKRHVFTITSNATIVTQTFAQSVKTRRVWLEKVGYTPQNGTFAQKSRRVWLFLGKVFLQVRVPVCPFLKKTLNLVLISFTHFCPISLYYYYYYYINLIVYSKNGQIYPLTCENVLPKKSHTLRVFWAITLWPAKTLAHPPRFLGRKMGENLQKTSSHTLREATPSAIK